MSSMSVLPPTKWPPPSFGPSAGFWASCSITIMSSTLWKRGFVSLCKLCWYPSVNSTGRFFKNQGWFLISGIVIRYMKVEIHYWETCWENTERMKQMYHRFRTCNENTGKKMSAIHWDSNIVGNWVVDTKYSLQKYTHCLVNKLKKMIFVWRWFIILLTPIVFLKFLGSSGSSNGYDPTSITYNVTPQDQTSAI